MRAILKFEMVFALLRDLITSNPFADEIDFSNKGLAHLDQNSVTILGKFSELRRLNLSDNEIQKLPSDLTCLTQVQELNLSGNPLVNLQSAVEALAGMSALESLQVNLHLEEEVDFLLRTLPNLKVLNGLPVERDAIFSSGSEDEADDQTDDDVVTKGNLTINAHERHRIPEEQSHGELSSSRLTSQAQRQPSASGRNSPGEGTIKVSRASKGQIEVLRNF